MAANGLYEFSVAPDIQGKNKVLYVILKILNIINFSVCVLSIVIAYFLDFLFVFVLLIFAISFIVIGIIKKALYSSYDCAYVGGSVRLDKVYNNRRKRLISFDVKNIIAIGSIESPNYNKYLNDRNVKNIYATPKDFYEKDYFMLINLNSNNYLVTMRYNKLFLSYVLRNINTIIIEKEYKEILSK